jgi:hypothetical protein
MPIKVGDKFDGHFETCSGKLAWPQQARVMAIAEGYAMLRFKGRMPFIEAIKDLERWNPQNEETSQ